jgi:hypothetical protein
MKNVKEMKNIKVANINTTIKKLFKDWLYLTKIFHKLTDQQINILSLFLYEYYKLKKEVTNERIINEVLFDYKIKMKIKEELGIKDPSLQNAMTIFRKKGIVVNNQLSKLFIPQIEKDANNFKLIYNFNIINEE